MTCGGPPPAGSRLRMIWTIFMRGANWSRRLEEVSSDAVLLQIKPQHAEREHPRPDRAFRLALKGAPERIEAVRAQQPNRLERLQSALAKLAQRPEHPAPHRKLKPALALALKIGAEQLGKSLAQEMFWTRTGRKSHRAGNRQGQIQQPLIEQRNADFQRVGHSIGIAIAQQHVAHIKLALQARDAPDQVARIDGGLGGGLGGNV